MEVFRVFGFASLGRDEKQKELSCKVLKKKGNKCKTTVKEILSMILMLLVSSPIPFPYSLFKTSLHFASLLFSSIDYMAREEKLLLRTITYISLYYTSYNLNNILFSFLYRITSYALLDDGPGHKTRKVKSQQRLCTNSIATNVTNLGNWPWIVEYVGSK